MTPSAEAAVRACTEDVAARIGRGRAVMLMLLCTITQNTTRLQLLADTDYAAEASRIGQAIADAVTLAAMELGIPAEEVERVARVLEEHCGTLRHSRPAS